MVCGVIFSQKMMLVTWMPEPPYWMVGQSRRMTAEWLSFEEHRVILRWLWKFENVCEVQRQWGHKFAMEPPTWLSLCISHILSNFQYHFKIILHCSNENHSTAIYFDCPAIWWWPWRSCDWYHLWENNTLHRLHFGSILKMPIDNVC